MNHKFGLKKTGAWVTVNYGTNLLRMFWRQAWGEVISLVDLHLHIPATNIDIEAVVQGLEFSLYIARLPRDRLIFIIVSSILTRLAFYIEILSWFQCHANKLLNIVELTMLAQVFCAHIFCINVCICLNINISNLSSEAGSCPDLNPYFCMNISSPCPPLTSNSSLRLMKC